MADPQHPAPPAHPPHAPEAHGDHAGPNFQAYMGVFSALCVLTLVSFIANWTLGHNLTSAGIIMAVAVVKAALVASIFMHLKYDWPKLYGIIIPVVILTVMMMIILMPDFVVYWNTSP
jgi:caa(3)-type oxidase subunit IV